MNVTTAEPIDSWSDAARFGRVRKRKVERSPPCLPPLEKCDARWKVSKSYTLFITRQVVAIAGRASERVAMNGRSDHDVSQKRTAPVGRAIPTDTNGQHRSGTARRTKSTPAVVASRTSRKQPRAKCRRLRERFGRGRSQKGYVTHFPFRTGHSFSIQMHHGTRFAK